ncbi:alpha/beta hydrolase [Streptomyces sp. NBC_01795]|uniref:alpha/beta hydrolase n=1 Tax=unclassified Streptomyces TaxID=2593676 RepID=UPI002DD8C198|nr:MULTISPECIES: alpha/beta hydrolase [unclassified Streptomyces]WSA92733.1 alpha/beta hydrolase [Streptomyces sp. NBC_01795]WSB77104.1 alpha/beta hydrolase [Streptomyces sp. NBC_01775]
MIDQSAGAAAPLVGTLPVPGATLRYEVRGAGPLLLLIAGGSGDGAVFDHVAPALADRFTVASYDARGPGRSPLDGPAEDQRVEVHAADARRLIDLLSPDEPAAVFGTSSGGITALGLLARHPGRLRRVIAHEPPLARALPEPAELLALFEDVRDTAVREGTGPAFAKLAAGLAARDTERDPARDTGRSTDASHEAPHDQPPLDPEFLARMHAGSAYFLRHILYPFTHHTPELGELKAASDRLVLAVGEDSRGTPLADLVQQLGRRVGAPVRAFPGGHIGVTEHPVRFAARLREVLAESLG